MLVRSGDRAKALTALFGLVREGVITSFKTNFFGQSGPGWKPHVTVTVVGYPDKAAMHRTGVRVLQELRPLIGGVSVTVSSGAHTESRR